MGRVTVMLRADDSLIQDVINPLKEDGRLTKILTAALEGYRDVPAIQRFLEDGVAYGDAGVSEELTARLDDAINALDDSKLRTERAQVILEDGATEFGGAGEKTSGTVGEVTQAEFQDLRKMVTEMYEVITGGSFVPSAKSSEVPAGESEEKITDFTMVDVGFNLEDVGSYSDEDSYTTAEPEVATKVEKPEPVKISSRRPVLVDDDEDEFNYSSADTDESHKEPVTNEPVESSSVLNRLAQSTNMGGF